MAVRTLTAELRALETSAVAASAYATAVGGAGGASSATGARVLAWPVVTSDEAGEASAAQLALQLQLARHELQVLHDHLQVANKRSEALQATVEQRDLELSVVQRHMRSSGALLGSLATFVP